ncbi:TPA: response regulator transcription factor [Photobacterium damselae]|uniref:DNA-binding response regulator n=3 Tax=Photobacterium damselae TaxID=38293 RepID=A0ABD6X583_PHODM|nr:response regulator transcription factor [Photobacterium damselae]EJN6958476.1 response regulator transcription factor [Photobacterium damselae]KAB1179622.1 response regulator transcription factor [Photobacterium damselae subsp. damselae]MBE8129462.1 response regulator transcription factor [Photobacterium damselae subsp. piscicida]MBF7098122.1 response regulator transcription factor [Photobacterium damselae]MCG3844197.1 response regulator transcription factor [Photobacterium damselae]
MSQKKFNILLIGLKTMNTELIINQINNNRLNDISFRNISNFNYDFKTSSYDLIIIDHHAISINKNINELLESKDSETPILIFNIDTDITTDTLLSWPKVKGILSKDSPIEHLIKSIAVVIEHGLWLPRQTLEQMLDYYRNHKPSNDTRLLPTQPLLTRREKQILGLLTEGKTNIEIAETLFVAETTVKSHIYNLYKKIDVKCRKEAIFKVKQLRPESM